MLLVLSKYKFLMYKMKINHMAWDKGLSLLDLFIRAISKTIAQQQKLIKNSLEVVMQRFKRIQIEINHDKFQKQNQHHISEYVGSQCEAISLLRVRLGHMKRHIREANIRRTIMKMIDALKFETDDAKRELPHSMRYYQEPRE